MPSEIVRERLLAQLRRRHELGLVALRAPAGFGKSVLLGQALAEGPAAPRDRDVVYRCSDRDARAGCLAQALVAACGLLVSGEVEPLTPAGAADLVVGALEGLAGHRAHVALLVDDVHRSGEEGAVLWAALLDRLSPRTHLVLAGRWLSGVPVASRVAAGTAVLLDATELAFRTAELAELAELAGAPGRAGTAGRAGPGGDRADPSTVDTELAAWPALASLLLRGHPGLVEEYLRDEILAGMDPLVVAVLAATAVVGGCPAASLHDVANAVAGTVGSAPGWTEAHTLGLQAVGTLRSLPLVHVRSGGCWPHPIWTEAAAPWLSGEARSRAVVAAARAHVHSGAVGDAGRLAVRVRHVDALRLAVREAFATQPPSVSLADLVAWSDSALLAPGSAEHGWLAAMIAVLCGDADGVGCSALEETRRAFELAGDEEGEARVLLQLGTLARSRGDGAELGRLLVRAVALADGGNLPARGLVALGQAVAAQLAGDPEGALRALDHVPHGSLGGEWAGQALMVRGTNLLLAGRLGPAIAALDAATGEGSEASRALAHDLLATARWHAGDPVGAMADAEVSESLARAAGSPTFLQLVRAARACLLAATGQRELARRLLESSQLDGRAATGDEAASLATVAEMLLLVDTGDLDGARALLRSAVATVRPVRSSVWLASLGAALLPGSPSPPARSAGRDVAIGRAVAAGRAAAAHLAGGPPAGEHHRPYLPARWCASQGAPVVISLRGSSRVERDLRPVDHPAWRRGRVRELCLHLAVVSDRSRAGVAADLWPDRSDAAAGQNLRVTLTHLLDVLEPDRPKSGGSRLVVDAGGHLQLNREGRLRVDVWESERHATALLATPSYERPSLLAHARRLVAVASGPWLGGAAIGEWFEPHRRRMDELVIAACLRGGAHALAAADHRLAGELAQRVLTADPWSERAHQLTVQALLEGGDADAARRAVLHALAVLEDLGASPAAATIELVHRVGLGSHVLGVRRPEARRQGAGPLP